jgi:hypothetical protein
MTSMVQQNSQQQMYGFAIEENSYKEIDMME